MLASFADWGIYGGRKARREAFFRRNRHDTL